jgi:acetyl esterase/lipase
MRPETRAQLKALGPELGPDMIKGTTALMASLAAPHDPAVEVTRDHSYGPDARNRLDIHRIGNPTRAPVLVYLHGGGFVMGDKTTPGLPFFDNIGQWAAEQGWVGVTMTYRLAPQNRWPSGPQDVALAVNWLRANIAAHGGDPDAIFLMGQSAGATHVAGYVSQTRFHTGNSAGVAGAIMLSAVLDPVTQPPNPFRDAYYGEDRSVLNEARLTDGLLVSPAPMLFTVSELDAREFQDQAAELAQAWHGIKGGYAPMEYLAGHNHLTPAQAIGSIEDDLGPRVVRFVATVTSSFSTCT